MSTPIDVYAAARLWAEQHGHQAPDDRLIDLAYTAGRVDALMAARDDLAGAAERLRAKGRAHRGTAAGVSLACFRLVELADIAGRGVGETAP